MSKQQSSRPSSSPPSHSPPAPESDLPSLHPPIATLSSSRPRRSTHPPTSFTHTFAVTPFHHSSIPPPSQPSPPRSLQPTITVSPLHPPPPQQLQSLPQPSAQSSQPEKKPHHRKRSPGHIKRPQNAFFIFRSDFVKKKIIPPDVERNHKNISTIAGIVWRKMTPEEKHPWEGLAIIESDRHKAMYPGYRYSGSETNAHLTPLDLAHQARPSRLPPSSSGAARDGSSAEESTSRSSRGTRATGRPPKRRSEKSRTLPVERAEAHRKRLNNLADMVTAGVTGQALSNAVHSGMHPSIDIPSAAIRPSLPSPLPPPPIPAIPFPTPPMTAISTLPPTETSSPSRPQAPQGMSRSRSSSGIPTEEYHRVQGERLTPRRGRTFPPGFIPSVLTPPTPQANRSGSPTSTGSSEDNTITLPGVPSLPPPGPPTASTPSSTSGSSYYARSPTITIPLHRRQSEDVPTSRPLRATASLPSVHTQLSPISAPPMSATPSSIPSPIPPAGPSTSVGYHYAPNMYSNVQHPAGINYASGPLEHINVPAPPQAYLSPLEITHIPSHEQHLHPPGTVLSSTQMVPTFDLVGRSSVPRSHNSAERIDPGPYPYSPPDSFRSLPQLFHLHRPFVPPHAQPYNATFVPAHNPGYHPSLSHSSSTHSMHHDQLGTHPMDIPWPPILPPYTLQVPQQAIQNYTQAVEPIQPHMPTLEQTSSSAPSSFSLPYSMDNPVISHPSSQYTPSQPPSTAASSSSLSFPSSSSGYAQTDEGHMPLDDAYPFSYSAAGMYQYQGVPLPPPTAESSAQGASADNASPTYGSQLPGGYHHYDGQGYSSYMDTSRRDDTHSNNN